MHRAVRLILTMLMESSDLPGAGSLFARVAGMFLGPYKEKRLLAYLTSKPYISPSARISCRGMSVGANSFIDELVTIYARGEEGKVNIGMRTHIYRGTNIEVGSGATAFIGDDTHIQGPCDIKAFRWDLRIGSDVQVAPFCALSSYDHSFASLDRPIRLQELTSPGETVIEDDVWLGAGVKVLAGVRIGKGSVIGAGSVVTRHIPPYSIAVGVPARVYRCRGEQRSLTKEVTQGGQWSGAIGECSS